MLQQVDIAHGVVHLVEIVLVVVVAGHTLQLADHTLAVGACHHLCLGYPGIEFQFIGRVLSYGVLIGFVGFVVVAQSCLYLSHEEPFTCFLRLAPFVLDHLAQVGYGLLQLTVFHVIVGIGVVPVLDGSVVNGVAVHIADHILSIVEPAEFCIVLGQPGTGDGVLPGLCLVEAAHIRKGGGRLIEFAFLELCLSHQQPCFPQEGVILLACQPFAVLGRLSARLFPLRLHFDAVLLDGFLHLLDGTLELSASY